MLLSRVSNLEAGERVNESARGTLGRGKSEERPLPYFVRFSGQFCGSVVMAEIEQEKSLKLKKSLKSLKLLVFPSSCRPKRTLFFSLPTSPTPLGASAEERELPQCRPSPFVRDI